MTIENYLAIVFGGVAIVGGVFIFAYRERLYRFFADLYRAVADDAGRRAAERSSPYWIGFTGAGFVFIGLVGIFIGIFSRG